MYHNTWCLHPYWDCILQNRNLAPGHSCSPLVLMVTQYSWYCTAWSLQYHSQIHSLKTEQHLGCIYAENSRWKKKYRQSTKLFILLIFHQTAACTQPEPLWYSKYVPTCPSIHWCTLPLVPHGLYTLQPDELHCGYTVFLHTRQYHVVTCVMKQTSP